MDNEAKTELARHDEQIKTLFKNQEDSKKDMECMTQAITEIRDRLIYRPTWVVTIIFSLLVAVCTSSVTFILMTIFKK